MWNLNKANSQNHRVWISGAGGNGEGWVKAQRFMSDSGGLLDRVVFVVNNTVLNT